jgi:uncharacterized repeat protein (TIGR01451 family)
MQGFFGSNRGKGKGLWRSVAAASVIASGLFTVVVATSGTAASATTPPLNFIDISQAAATIQYDGTGTAGWSNHGSATACSNGGVSIAGSQGLFNCGKAIGTSSNPFPVTDQAPTFTAPANSGVFASAFLQNQVSGSYTTCPGAATNPVKGGNEFGPGQKFTDDPSSDTYLLGPVTGKDEISNVYAVARQNSAGQDEVYVGMERTINTGDTHADFQFLQEPVAQTTACSGSFTGGVHEQGDVVLEINFDNGGANPTSNVLVWSCSGSLTGTLSNPGTPCSASVKGSSAGWVTETECPTSTPAPGCYDQGAVAIGTNATASIPCGAWICKDGSNTAVSSLLSNEFMEGAINLDALGVTTGCAATFFPVTRSAGSGQPSTLQSFATPTKFQTCANTTTTTTPSVGSGGSGQLGSTFTDSAKVQASFGTASPQGTVTFYACGPTASEPTAAPACSPTAGNAISVGSTSATSSTGSGYSVFTSPGFKPAMAGWYCFDAEYAPAAGVKLEASSDGGALNECFHVLPLTPGFTTTQANPTDTSVGNSWGDSATASGTTGYGAPNGTATFTLCQESGTTACTGGTTLATGVTGTSSGNNTTFTLPAVDDAKPTTTGTYCFNASFTATAPGNYSSVAQQSDSECFTVTKAATGTKTTVASANVTLATNGTISDNVTVTGNATAGPPTGTVNFYVCQITPPATSGYCPSTGTVQSSATLSPTNTPGVSSGSSAAYLPTSAGVYCFGATYSGDGNYLPSADNTSAPANPAECAVVAKAATTTGTTVHDAASGGTYPTSGETAPASTYDTATVTGLPGITPTGSVTFDYFANGNCQGNPSATSSGTLSAGTAESATETAANPGSYSYLATYGGDSNYLGSKGSCESFIVLAPASVSAVKSETPNDPTTGVNLGSTINYTITLSNTGDVPATGVTVSDPVPGGTTYVTGSGGVLNGGTVVFSNVTVPAASNGTPGTTSVSFSVTVNSGDANGLSIPNTASFTNVNTANCVQGSATPANSCDTNTVYEVVKYPVLAATKATPDNGPTVKPGDTITYQIKLTNSGQADATNVTITDPVPAGTKWVSGGTYDPGTNTVSFSGLTVPAGQSLIETFVVTVNANDTNGEVIPNTATFTNENTPNCPATSATCNTNTVTQTVEFPIVEASKAADPASGSIVNLGQTITYTISVQNYGLLDATNVTVTDPVPAGTDLGQINNGGSATGGLITWTVPDVPAGTWNTTTKTVTPGTAETVSFTVTVDPADANGQTILNTASASNVNTPNCTTTDSTPAGECDTNTTTHTVNFPVVTAAKTSNPGDGATVAPGDTISYTITLTNAGLADATNVVVTDNVPAGTTLSSIGNSGTVNGTQLSWTVPVVKANNGTATVSFVVTVNAADVNGQQIPNVASFTNVNTPGCSNSPTCTTNTVTQTVEFPILSATKSSSPADGSTVTPGTQITYTINLANAGGAAATNVAVTDSVPAGTTFVSATGGGTLDKSTGTITWTVPTVAANQGTASVSFTVTVDSADTNGTVIPNVAYFTDNHTPNCATTSTTPSGDCDTNTVKETVEFPIISATKSQSPADGSPVSRGDSITYTVSVVNSGLVDATDVTVTDAVPAGSTFVSAANGGTFDKSTNTITWTVPTVPAGTLGSDGKTVTPGAAQTVSFTVKVDSTDVNQQKILNTASATDVNTPTCTTTASTPTGQCNTNTVTAIVVFVPTAPAIATTTTTTTVAPTTTTKPASGLAFTGADIFPTIGAGLLLGGGGGIMVLLSRKRQRRRA